MRERVSGWLTLQLPIPAIRILFEGETFAGDFFVREIRVPKVTRVLSADCKGEKGEQRT